MKQYLILGWNSYYSKVQKLAEIIFSHPCKYDKIVGISRCGLTLGHLLSDFLQIPVIIVGAKSYKGIQQQGEVKITETLGAPIRGKHILLVDGISDSGKTLLYVIEYLKGFKPKRITTATLFYKPRSIYKPDYYVQKTNKWILFPYEATEWIVEFTQKMKAKKKMPLQIKKYLSKLGYSKQQQKLASAILKNFSNSHDTLECMI